MNSLLRATLATGELLNSVYLSFFAGKNCVKMRSLLGVNKHFSHKNNDAKTNQYVSQRVTRLNRNALSCVSLLLICVLAGCDNGEQSQAKTAAESSTNQGNELRILAGSELKDIAEMSENIAAKTGVQLRFEYSGTLDAVEKISAGEDYDAVWVSHGKYLQITPEANARIKQSEKTMLSPVVLGLKDSVAKKLGWCGNPDVTWKEIAVAAESGKFSFGMTNPASSNSGFTALIGLTAALSGKSDALTIEDIKANKTASFFKAQRLTAGSSGWLADAYVRDQRAVDGIINYESVLLSMNQNTALTEKLCLIYPKEGIITADYPLMLLSDVKKSHYDKVVNYLRTEDFQQQMMDKTLRRPISPAIKLASNFPTALLIELPFPANLTIVDMLLEQFQNAVRIPAHSWFVLDTSGSMGTNGGIEQLRASIAGLSGEDTSASGKLSHFLNREHIEFITFSSEVNDHIQFEMSADDQKNITTRQAIARFSRSLGANGGTAIYDAVQKAYSLALNAQENEKNNYYQTIVLMTDGKNTNGHSFSDFRTWFNNLSENQKKIRVFALAFGDADLNELNELTKLTGGKTFDGRKGNLRQIFKEVRGYQ